MSESEWVELATAPNEWTAHIWRGILAEEGINVIIRGGDITSFLGPSALPCRLLAPRALKDAALDVLRDQITGCAP